VPAAVLINGKLVRLEQPIPSEALEVSTSSSVNQWEAGEAGAVPRLWTKRIDLEVSTRTCINQRETGEAGAAKPSAFKASTSSSVDQGETGKAGAAFPSLVEV
jgi:hypothetical protein